MTMSIHSLSPVLVTLPRRRLFRMPTRGTRHWEAGALGNAVSAVREKFLPECGTISQVAMSAMDDWRGETSERNVPALIVVEGPTMYCRVIRRYSLQDAVENLVHLERRDGRTEAIE